MGTTPKREQKCTTGTRTENQANLNELNTSLNTRDNVCNDDEDDAEETAVEFTVVYPKLQHATVSFEHSTVNNLAP